MTAAFAASALAVCCANPAAAGEVEQVARGMLVTTDAGEQVRVLAYDDGTFRITVAEDLAAVSPSLMVTRDADGAPVFRADATSASLSTHLGHAMVQLADGRLKIYDAAGQVLLDEHAPARRMQPVTLEGQRVLANGREVLDRWRQNWKPWYHHFELDLRAGERVDLRIEWQPNAGYIALEYAEPLPAEDRHSVSFASEAARD
jgi:hypothetical protein